MTATAPLPKLLDAAGLAEHLGVDQRYVRRLVAERRIPFVKWGHYIRFDPTDIAAWLEDVKVPERDTRVRRFT
jgi:excisionase family DNA binding protein